MIKFSCNNCGHKLGVRDEMAGKRGKCPECSGIIVVPEKNLLVSFQCENCGSNISALPTQSGKKGKCPNCNLTVVVPQLHGLTFLDAPAEYKLQDRQPNPPAHPQQEIENEENEQEPKEEIQPYTSRKLPWFIDILLYPLSVSGMVHLAILSFLPRMLLPLGHGSYWMHPDIFGLGFVVIFTGYLLYCLFDCVRDSADGGRRASDIEVSVDILLNAWELISPVLKVSVCIAICFGPLLLYSIITQRTDTIFWFLALYAVIFSPITFLAVILFDSFRALNPILIITSIYNVFIHYCGLAAICFAGGLFVSIIMASQPRSSIIGYFFSAACIYLAMVMAHLLGRFYWKYQDKLNWEV